MRGAAPLRPVGRLTKRNDFVAAASGRRFHTGRMTVQGRVREDDRGLRFGLTVTRRVGHAVERNRIKRRLRHALRAALDHVQEADGALACASADVVLVARRDALEADYASLVEDIASALHVVTRPGRGARRSPPAPGSVGSARDARDAASHPSND